LLAGQLVLEWKKPHGGVPIFDQLTGSLRAATRGEIHSRQVERRSILTCAETVIILLMLVQIAIELSHNKAR
jgi:hypothetical protein